MPTVRQMLDEVVKGQGVPLWIVEKDYALSYLLAAIAKTSGLGDAITVKGGTALRKLYFKDYRFSEDLDYSSLSQTSIPDLDALIEEAVSHLLEMLEEVGPFQVNWQRLRLRDPHPGDQAAYDVRIQFPYQRQPLCRLKVEITVDEHVLLPQEQRPILHGYAGQLEAIVTVYPLEEIVAEKLRALLESSERLEEKGWGASRACRDYYDLWWVLTKAQIDEKKIASLTLEKCVARNVTFKTPDDFFKPELITLVGREWDQQLRSFVINAPNHQAVLDEVQVLVHRVWG